MQGTQVRSLVRELRSHMLLSVAKKKKSEYMKEKAHTCGTHCVYPPHIVRVLSMKKKPAWASGPVWLEARESGEWWPSAQASARGDCDITGADTWWTFTNTSFWHCLQPPAQGWEWGKGTALCLQVHDGRVMAGAAHGGSGNVQGCCPPSSLVSWARDLSCRPPSCTGTI